MRGDRYRPVDEIARRIEWRIACGVGAGFSLGGNEAADVHRARWLTPISVTAIDQAGAHHDQGGSLGADALYVDAERRFGCACRCDSDRGHAAASTTEADDDSTESAQKTQWIRRFRNCRI